MDDYPWQKLTWPMARWAKKYSFMKIYLDMTTNRHTVQLPCIILVKSCTIWSKLYVSEWSGMSTFSMVSCISAISFRSFMVRKKWYSQNPLDDTIISQLEENGFWPIIFSPTMKERKLIAVMQDTTEKVDMPLHSDTLS